MPTDAASPIILDAWAEHPTPRRPSVITSSRCPVRPGTQRRSTGNDRAISEGQVVNDDRPVALLLRDEPDTVHLLAVVAVDVLPRIRLLVDRAANAAGELGKGNDGVGHELLLTAKVE